MGHFTELSDPEIARWRRQSRACVRRWRHWGTKTNRAELSTPARVESSVPFRSVSPYSDQKLSRPVPVWIRAAGPVWAESGFLVWCVFKLYLGFWKKVLKGIWNLHLVSLVWTYGQCKYHRNMDDCKLLTLHYSQHIKENHQIHIKSQFVLLKVLLCSCHVFCQGRT